MPRPPASGFTRVQRDRSREYRRCRPFGRSTAPAMSPQPVNVVSISAKPAVTSCRRIRSPLGNQRRFSRRGPDPGHRLSTDGMWLANRVSCSVDYTDLGRSRPQPPLLECATHEQTWIAGILRRCRVRGHEPGTIPHRPVLSRRTVTDCKARSDGTTLARQWLSCRGGLKRRARRSRSPPVARNWAGRRARAAEELDQPRYCHNVLAT